MEREAVDFGLGRLVGKQRHGDGGELRVEDFVDDRAIAVADNQRFSFVNVFCA